MTAFTCMKCGRRFTPTAEDIQSYLATSEGKRHAMISCPHCGKGNKVAPERLRQAVRFVTLDAPAAPDTPATSDIPATPS